MMINPLPNNRIPKPKDRQFAAIKTLFPRINLEDEIGSSSILNSLSRR